MDFKFKLAGVKVNVPEHNVAVEVGELSVEMTNLNITEYAQATISVVHTLKDLFADLNGKETHEEAQTVCGSNHDRSETGITNTDDHYRAQFDQAESHSYGFDPFKVQPIDRS